MPRRFDICLYPYSLDLIKLDGVTCPVVEFRRPGRLVGGDGLGVLVYICYSRSLRVSISFAVIRVYCEE